MMTKTSSQETARQKLGNVLRFYREQRRLDTRNIADRVGVSIREYEDWENGLHAPPQNRWGRLCNMLHDKLSEVRPLWTQALAEEERAREHARIASKPLTSLPFKALGQLVTKQAAPPVLKVVPSPAPPAPQPGDKPALTSTTDDGTLIAVPETLVGEEFDLTEAYKRNLSLPAGWRGREAAEKRAAFVMALIDREPTLTVDEIVARTRVAFDGVGVSPNTISTCRKELAAKKVREVRKAEASPTPVSAPAPAPALEIPPVPITPVKPVVNDAALEEWARMMFGKAPSIKNDGPGGIIAVMTNCFGRALPDANIDRIRQEVRAAAKKAAEVVALPPPPPLPVKTPLEGNVETAMQLLMETIPNLATFAMTVSESGEVTSTYTTREVKVVEQTSTVTIRRKDGP